jgi:hypothetical protein
MGQASRHCADAFSVTQLGWGECKTTVNRWFFAKMGEVPHLKVPDIALTSGTLAVVE